VIIRPQYSVARVLQLGAYSVCSDSFQKTSVFRFVSENQRFSVCVSCESVKPYKVRGL